MSGKSDVITHMMKYRYTQEEYALIYMYFKDTQINVQIKSTTFYLNNNGMTPNMMKFTKNIK